MADELRVRTIIELSAFQQEYIHCYAEDSFDELTGCSYEEAIYESAIDGGYSSIWAVCGLASVIKRQIKLVYPHANGKSDRLALAFNRNIDPRQDNFDKREPIYLMWTRQSTTTDCIWFPNHFVPLFPTQIHESCQIAVSDPVDTERCSSVNSNVDRQENRAVEKSLVDQRLIQTDLDRDTASTEAADVEYHPQLIEAHKRGTRLVLDGYSYIRNRCSEDKM